MKPASIVRYAALAAFLGLVIYGLSPRFAAKKVERAAAKHGLAFDLPAVGGGRWSLAEHRGDIVFVNFWATWCPPCRTETPGLVAAANRYAGRGVKFVGITLDGEPDQVVPAFVKEYRVPYPMLVPTPDFQFANTIASLPTSLLIGRDGRVAHTYVGMVDEQDLASDIDELLGGRP